MAQITNIVLQQLSNCLIMKEACYLFIFIKILKVLTFHFLLMTMQPQCNQQFLIDSIKKK